MVRTPLQLLNQIAQQGTLFEREERTLHLVAPTEIRDIVSMMRLIVRILRIPATLIDVATCTERTVAELQSPMIASPQPLIIIVCEGKSPVVPPFLERWYLQQELNCRALSISEIALPHSLPITFPAHLDRALFRAISKIIGRGGSLFEETSDMIFTTATRADKMSWAQGVQLAHYPALLGRRYELFCKGWLAQVMMPRYSLFTLANYLFTGNAAQFYPLWGIVSAQYPVEFWVSFWSDTFWRAYLFREIAEREGVAQATALVRKLPYQFTQGHWKRWSLDQLKECMEQLYLYDCRSKQGGSIIPFELIFAPFLH